MEDKIKGKLELLLLIEVQVKLSLIDFLYNLYQSVWFEYIKFKPSVVKLKLVLLQLKGIFNNKDQLLESLEFFIYNQKLLLWVEAGLGTGIAFNQHGSSNFQYGNAVRIDFDAMIPIN